jgi:hypothetical protein
MQITIKQVINMRIAIPALGCLMLFACRSRDAEAPPYRPDTIDMHPISTYLSPQESMNTIHLPTCSW